MSKLRLMIIYSSLFFSLAGCGTYEEPIQPSRYQIENIDRNAGDNQDSEFPVDPSVRWDDESINRDKIS